MPWTVKEAPKEACTSRSRRTTALRGRAVDASCSRGCDPQPRATPRAPAAVARRHARARAEIGCDAAGVGRCLSRRRILMTADAVAMGRAQVIALSLVRLWARDLAVGIALAGALVGIDITFNLEALVK